jgi:hypothetical protein
VVGKAARLAGPTTAQFWVAWQQVLTWRDMIRMNNQVPVPAGAVSGRATTPLPHPATVIEKLACGSASPRQSRTGTLW